MRNRLLYILCAGALTFSACENSIVNEVVEPDINGPFPKGEKIDVAACLSTGAPSTRAVNKEFEPNDKLLAYVQAGKTTTDENGVKTFTPVVTEANLTDEAAISIYSKMLEFTMKEQVTNTEHVLSNDVNIPTWLDRTNTNQTSDFTSTSSYYWDDFSTTDYDLRDADRGIRLFYGYCYNGGTPSTALAQTTGVLGWKVADDQTGGYKSNDLLFAMSQDMIRYSHNKTDNTRGVLQLPYTHAMSMFTITVECGEGYSEDVNNLANTTINLFNVQKECTVTAPTATIKQSTEANAVGDIKMHAESSDNKKKTFTAIAAPTTLSVGNRLAEIKDVNGLNYYIYISDNLLSTAAATTEQNWKSQLDEVVENIDEGVAHAPERTRASIDRGKGYRTRSGVHYHLTVRVDKQKITTYATITDWKDVSAKTSGTINFTNDFTGTGTTTDLNGIDQYDIFTSMSNTDNGSFDSKSSVDGINPATKMTNTAGTWSSTNTLYWENATDGYYFRAIAGDLKSSDASTGTITISNTKDGGHNNNEVYWATTPKNENNTTNDGDKISPRTCDVALKFSPIMSKVRFILETETENGQLANDGVNLSGAKIQIENIGVEGNLSLNDGKISVTNYTGTLFATGDVPVLYYHSDKLTADNDYQVVLPQTISDDAKITITLSDGTTYTAKLKDCLLVEGGATTNTKIESWEPGKRYTYSIYLKKEQMNFRALIQNWTETEGKGEATLEWD